MEAAENCAHGKQVQVEGGVRLAWQPATETNLPEECRPVLAKVDVDGLECIVMITLVYGEWVTDATVSEVYGCEPHTPVHRDYTPTEWAYLD